MIATSSSTQHKSGIQKCTRPEGETVSSPLRGWLRLRDENPSRSSEGLSVIDSAVDSACKMHARTSAADLWHCYNEYVDVSAGYQGIAKNINYGRGESGIVRGDEMR